VINPEEIAPLPRRPESVAEWEELLVRLEVVPRVVRNTVEEVTDDRSAAAALADAARREGEVGLWLEVASGVREDGDGSATAVEVEGGATDLAHRFASLRARTFAMLQRRGLEVWEWEAPLAGSAAVTTHQLLLWLVRRDAQLLAQLRQATVARRVGC
jgi:hypothetical protein